MFLLYQCKLNWNLVSTIWYFLIFLTFFKTVDAINSTEGTTASIQGDEVKEAVKVVGDFLRSEKGIEWLDQVTSSQVSRLTTLDIITFILRTAYSKSPVWNAAKVIKDALDKDSNIELDINGTSKDDWQDNWINAVTDAETDDDIICLYRKNNNHTGMKKSEDWKKLLDIMPDYTIYSVTDKGSKYFICLKKINVTETSRPIIPSMTVSSIESGNRAIIENEYKVNSSVSTENNTVEKNSTDDHVEDYSELITTTEMYDKSYEDCYDNYEDGTENDKSNQTTEENFNCSSCEETTKNEYQTTLLNQLEEVDTENVSENSVSTIENIDNDITLRQNSTLDEQKNKIIDFTTEKDPNETTTIDMDVNENERFSERPGDKNNDPFDPLRVEEDVNQDNNSNQQYRVDSNFYQIENPNKWMKIDVTPEKSKNVPNNLMGHNKILKPSYSGDDIELGSKINRTSSAKKPRLHEGYDKQDRKKESKLHSLILGRIRRPGKNAKSKKRSKTSQGINKLVHMHNPSRLIYELQKNFLQPTRHFKTTVHNKKRRDPITGLINRSPFSHPHKKNHRSDVSVLFRKTSPEKKRKPSRNHRKFWMLVLSLGTMEFYAPKTSPRGFFKMLNNKYQSRTLNQNHQLIPLSLSNIHHFLITDQDSISPTINHANKLSHPIEVNIQIRQPDQIGRKHCKSTDNLKEKYENPIPFDTDIKQDVQSDKSQIPNVGIGMHSFENESNSTKTSTEYYDDIGRTTEYSSDMD